MIAPRVGRIGRVQPDVKAGVLTKQDRRAKDQDDAGPGRGQAADAFLGLPRRWSGSSTSSPSAVIRPATGQSITLEDATPELLAVAPAATAAP